MLVVVRSAVSNRSVAPSNTSGRTQAETVKPLVRLPMAVLAGMVI